MLIDALKSRKAVSLLDGYYNLLTSTGSVGHKDTMRFLVYLFLLEFVDDVYYFFSTEDYDKVNDLLGKIMGSDSCLMPYDLYCDGRQGNRHATLGSTFYMGPFVRRVTEDEKNRSTEDEQNLRKPE